ncbi:unnamed protein product [Schistocephalus solidus]|uniref:Secreted protein n=1 Tax=Schistocephalus solidus TaxID=70667 RepID=A0A183SFF9_SCHSO|nr:unnamed protein product [Schistocephalus solidus]
MHPIGPLMAVRKANADWTTGGFCPVFDSSGLWHAGGGGGDTKAPQSKEIATGVTLSRTGVLPTQGFPYIPIQTESDCHFAST